MLIGLETIIAISNPNPLVLFRWRLNGGNFGKLGAKNTWSNGFLAGTWRVQIYKEIYAWRSYSHSCITTIHNSEFFNGGVGGEVFCLSDQVFLFERVDFFFPAFSYCFLHALVHY